MNLHTATDRLYARKNMRECALRYWDAIRSMKFDGNYNARIRMAFEYLTWAIYWRNRSRGASTV